MVARVAASDRIGGRYRELEDGGIEVSRVFVVDQVDGPAFARHERAKLAPSVPRRSDRHPLHREALAVEFNVDAIGPSQFTVEVVYRTPSAGAGGLSTEVGGPTLAEWVSELASETVIHDKNGNLIQTSYSAAGGLITRTHRVQVERALYSVRLTRTLAASARDFNRRYTNRINSRPWSGFPQYAVRCRGFSSNQVAPRVHQVTGLFSVSPTADGTWRTTVVSDDGEGVIPTDIIRGNGLELIDNYDAVDFNGSGFEVPSE